MTLIRLFLLISLSFSFVINSNAQEVSTNTKTPPQNNSAGNNVRVALDDYFRKAAGLGFAGAVLVAKDGEIITRKSYGWADVKRQIPIKPDTIFDIGSGVKAFTATAIMQLEEQDKLSASDPITKYFKDVPADKANITIHQLLTHTSGLNFDYFYDGASFARTQNRTQRGENSVRALYARRKTLGLSRRLENRFISKKTPAIDSSFKLQVQNQT